METSTTNLMIIDPKRYLLIVTGPTAVGKTTLTIQLAQHLKTEILSADSRQFYKEMRIGTARPKDNELRMVPHHFTGHISILDEYNASRFESDALNLLEKLFTTHQFAIMTGGSGLYLNAVCHGIDDLPDPDITVREELKQIYASEGIQALRSRLRLLDPRYYEEADIANPKRLLRALEVCITTGVPYSELRTKKPKPRDFECIWIGLSRDRDELNQRINDRVDRMMHDGLLKEVETLIPFRNFNALNTVGYKELFEWFDGTITLGSAVENIKTHTRRYAKRQMTWFRKTKDIIWFHPDDYDKIHEFVLKQLQN